MSQTTNFNVNWLTDPKFSGWSENTHQVHIAKRMLCVKDIDLGNMGNGVLRSHTHEINH